MRRAIVVGRAEHVTAEYDAAVALHASAGVAVDDVVVVGRMGEVFPHRIDHWVSFHADHFVVWNRARARGGHPPPARCWGAVYRGRKLPTHGETPAPMSYVRAVGGSSGFMAVQVALNELGCDHVVLTGVSMSTGDRHAVATLRPREVSEKVWGEADKYWPTWVEHMDWMRGRVKSMSGRTRDALGEPTAEWLRAPQ